jgi:hypothetical protein
METENNAAAPAAQPERVLVVIEPKKVKTLVIMDVPEGPLLCCQLEDLTLKPERGASYVYEGCLFDVERAIEVIGIYKRGSKKSTDEQLIDLLKMLSGGQQSVVRVANMRNIGMPDSSETAGGIILATSLSFTAGADRLIYLKLRLAFIGAGVEGIRALARQAMDGAQKTAAAKGTGDGSEAESHKQGE